MLLTFAVTKMNSAGGFAALFVARQMACLSFVTVQKVKDNTVQTESIKCYLRQTLLRFLIACRSQALSHSVLRQIFLSMFGEYYFFASRWSRYPLLKRSSNAIMSELDSDKFTYQRQQMHMPVIIWFLSYIHV